MKVYIVTKDVDSPWSEDRDMEIVKVFKGIRIRAATKWAIEQDKKNPGYVFCVEPWEVE